MAGAGGLAVFAQANSLNMATDFNGGLRMAAAMCMARGRQQARLEKFNSLVDQAEALDNGA